MLKFKRGLLAAVAAVALASACGSDELAKDEDNARADEDSDEGKAKDDSDDEKPVDAGKTKPKDAGTATAPKDAGKTEPTGEVKGTGLPCDVAKIVSTHCASCHGVVPKFADFSLTTLADFAKAAKIDKDKRPLHQVAYDRVNGQAAARMPPTSVPAIPPADLKVLSDWLKAGAKSGSDSCEVKSPVAATGGDAGVAAKPPGSSNGVSTTPIEYADKDELFCQQFLAYNASDKTKKYDVPNKPDLYMGFRILPKWKGMQYARSFRVITDNDKAIHHWLFFQDTSKKAEGVSSQSGAHPDGILQHGWAPGGDSLYFEPDYGIELSGDLSYLLEAHYNNTGSAPTPDASGVEVCVSPKKPKNLAAVSWVGTDAIAGTSATGTCTPKSGPPITILAGSPHMHKKGKHMKVVWNKKGGEKKVMFDEDFSFENQRQYLMTDFVLQPGDTLTTTCDFTGPSTFGTSTMDEMCYFFSVHTPAMALVSDPLSGLVSNVIHGPNTCLN